MWGLWQWQFLCFCSQPPPCNTRSLSCLLALLLSPPPPQAMDAVWGQGDQVQVIHPAAACISGRALVRQRGALRAAATGGVSTYSPQSYGSAVSWQHALHAGALLTCSPALLQVLESWASILRGVRPNAFKITLEDVRVFALSETTGLVTCVEVVEADDSKGRWVGIKAGKQSRRATVHMPGWRSRVRGPHSSCCAAVPAGLWPPTCLSCRRGNGSSSCTRAAPCRRRGLDRVGPGKKKALALSGMLLV